MSGKNRPLILIVHTGRELIFAERDRELLQARFATKTFGLTGFGDWRRLRREMRQADVVIFWFVGRAAFYGMVFPPRRSKIVSLVGGYEASRIREFSYGSGLSFWKRHLLRYIFARSDRIVAVSEFTRQELHENYAINPSRVTVIPNAIDTALFLPHPTAIDRNLVFTVGHISKQLIQKKGFDLLAGVAQRLPALRFVVAGRIKDQAAQKFIGQAPPNMEFVGQISQGALRKLYQSANVYFQPSRHESFGVSVVEAMSCGCVPVVSNLGALPEVVGPDGFILDHLEPDHAVSVLKRALSSPVAARVKARTRVVENFDYRFRAEKLGQLLEGLLTPPPD